jgi:hypothetical protein
MCCGAHEAALQAAGCTNASFHAFCGPSAPPGPPKPPPPSPSPSPPSPAPPSLPCCTDFCAQPPGCAFEGAWPAHLACRPPGLVVAVWVQLQLLPHASVRADQLHCTAVCAALCVRVCRLVRWMGLQRPRGRSGRLLPHHVQGWPQHARPLRVLRWPWAQAVLRPALPHSRPQHGAVSLVTLHAAVCPERKTIQGTCLHALVQTRPNAHLLHVLNNQHTSGRNDVPSCLDVDVRAVLPDIHAAHDQSAPR